MSWFRRTRDPLVTDDYLQTAETVSRPMAIIYTIVMVFVVGALAFSIFFGGRWLYQNLDGSNKPTITVVENPITTTPVNGQATSSAATSTTSGTTNASSSNSSNSTNTTTATATVQNTSSTTSNTNTTTSGSVSAVATAIPATGPTEIVTVFVTATIIAAVTHNLYIRRKLSK